MNSNIKHSSNKRGQIGLDIIILMVILFVFGTVVIVMSFVGMGISEELLLDEDVQKSNETVETLNMLHDDMPTLWDNLYLMILILMWIGMLVTSFLIDSHPLFFYISLIIVIIVMIIGIWMGNAFLELASDPEFSSVITSFPKMMWIADNWLIVIMIVSFTTMLALYAKGQYTG